MLARGSLGAEGRQPECPVSETLSGVIPWLENPVLLGKGAFAEVYRVTDRRTGRLLACKINRHKAMAEQEKEFLRCIEHPLFPAYHGFFCADEFYCILMEYISGCNLKEFVIRRGALRGTQAVRIVQELAEGLLYLHEQSRPMIFRDLKPENVMLQADGKVRLVDVGCICYLEGAEITRAGTPGYAAPEQLQQNASTGRESDVYALGKLLRFMLTGKEEQTVRPMDKKGKRRISRPMDKKGKRRLSRLMHKKGKRKISRRMRKILHMTTRTEAKYRIQDVRIFLQMLSRRRVPPDFYYEKNIRRGL